METDIPFYFEKENDIPISTILWYIDFLYRLN